MDGKLYNINKSIKDDKIDYVVMGTEGASGWSEFFSGTHTGNVLTDVDVPILCIPIDAKYKKTETIGFTTRLDQKIKKALKKVVKLAKWQVQKVKCLYVKLVNQMLTKKQLKMGNGF
jgi:hypothetical protein